MRLSRGGRKKMPFYSIVVADSRRPRDGKFIEKIGYYNPFAKEGEIKFHLKEDRAEYWAGVGAQAGEGLAKLMVAEGKGPQNLRDKYSKLKARRSALKAEEIAAKKKAEAEAKAKEEAEAKAAEAENAASETAEAAPAEGSAPVEAAAEAPAEEAPAAEETPATESSADEAEKQSA